MRPSCQANDRSQQPPFLTGTPDEHDPESRPARFALADILILVVPDRYRAVRRRQLSSEVIARRYLDSRRDCVSFLLASPTRHPRGGGTMSAGGIAHILQSKAGI